MSALFDFFGGPVGKALIAALLHGVWIGLVVLAVVGAAFKRLHESRAGARYRVALAGQFFTLAATVALWAFLQVDESRRGMAREGDVVAENPMPAGAAVASTSASGASPVAVAVFVERAEERASPPWQVWGGLAWMAGAVFSLARAGLSLRAAGRLRCSARPAEDAGLLEALARQSRRLGVRRRVDLLVSELASGAFVLGCLRPALVLPAAWAAGCPPAVLDAVIAHELSHVRHQDYLVNAVQLVAEALLFFNPAMRVMGVWARAEREARCDAEAAGAGDAGRDDYALALLVCHRLAAGAGPESAAAPAILGGAGGGRAPLRRLFRPRGGARPPLPRAMFATAVLVLTAASALLFGASRLLAERLSSREKIGRIAEIQRHYGWVRAAGAADDPWKRPTKRVRVELRTEEGDAPPPGWKAKALTRLPGVVSSYLGTSPDGADAFFVDTPAGELSLAVEAEGFAPLLREAKSYRSVEEIPDRLFLTLRRGARLPVKILDVQTGEAVNAPRVTVTARGSGGELDSKRELRPMPENDGRVWLEHLDLALFLEIRVEAEGYASRVQRARSYRLDEEPEWRLERDRPATGRLVDALTGAPVAGAQLRTCYREEIATGRTHHWDERSGPLLATSDAEGNYKIAGLEQGMVYGVWATAPGYARVLMPGLASGQAAAPLGLERALEVKGRVLLPAWYKRESVELGVVQDVHVKQFSSAVMLPSVRCAVREGAAEFEVGGLGRMGMRLRALEEWTGWPTFNEIPAEVVWDLRGLPAPAERPRRRVELRFARADDAPPPAGTVQVSACFSAPKGESPVVERRSMPIKEGRVEFDLPVPNELEITASGLIGYTFAPQRRELKAGSGAAEIELAALPSGAIYGEIRSPETLGSVHASVKRRRWLRDDEAGEGVSVELGASPEGLRFFVTPLPLGGAHVLEVTRGNTWARFDLPALSEEEPVRKLELDMPALVRVQGRVLDPAGRPVRAASVQLYGEMGKGRHRIGETVRTGDDGRFALEGVTPDCPIGYWLRVSTETGFALRRVKLSRRTIGRAHEIVMRPGLVIEGELVDAAGRPVQGVMMVAAGENQPVTMNLPAHAGSDACMADGPTDARGRFRFSTLPGTPVRVMPSNVNGWVRAQDAARVDPRAEHAVRVTLSQD